jgi:hypothetical protein
MNLALALPFLLAIIVFFVLTIVIELAEALSRGRWKRKEAKQMSYIEMVALAKQHSLPWINNDGVVEWPRVELPQVEQPKTRSSPVEMIRMSETCGHQPVCNYRMITTSDLLSDREFDVFYFECKRVVTVMTPDWRYGG